MAQVDSGFLADGTTDRYVHSRAPSVESGLTTDRNLMTPAHSDHTHPETAVRISASWHQAAYPGAKEGSGEILAETDVDRDHTLGADAGEPVSVDSIVVHALYSKQPSFRRAPTSSTRDVRQADHIR